MTEELEMALEDIAERFEMTGSAMWSGSQVADALRRYIADPDALLTNRDVPLSNRDDEGRDT